MGTLMIYSIVNPLDPGERFKQDVKQAIVTDGNSAAFSVAGVGAGPALDFPATPHPGVADNVEGAKTMQAEGFFPKFHHQALLAIDTGIPPANALLPYAITDPTIPLAASIGKIVAMLRDLGIDPWEEWLAENLTGFLSIPPDVVAAMAVCDNRPMAEALHDIDPTIDIDEAEEKLGQHCGFDLPSLPSPELSIPIPGLDLTDPFGPPEFNGFIWRLIEAFKKIPGLIADIIADLPGLMTSLLGGIPGFIMKLIEMLMEAILSFFAMVFDFLKQAVILIAQVIVLIKDIISAVIVCLVAFLLGPGIVAFFAAALLGLVV